MALQLIPNYEHHLITNSLEKNSFSCWFDILKNIFLVPEEADNAKTAYLL